MGIKKSFMKSRENIHPLDVRNRSKSFICQELVQILINNSYWNKREIDWLPSSN